MVVDTAMGCLRSLLLLAALAPRVAAEGSFCCLAASDLDDVCGSCFPAAVAKGDSECGPSEDACTACGGGTTWCPADGGLSTPAPPVSVPAEAQSLGSETEALEDDSTDDEFDCHAGLNNWRAGWSELKKEWCCSNQELGCEDADSSVGGASVEPDAAPVPDVNDKEDKVSSKVGPAVAPTIDENDAGEPADSEDKAHDPVITAVTDSGADAGGAKCASAGEDCSTSKCCADAGQQCFKKNRWWAGCKSTCTPGIDKSDPPDAQTPWDCSVLGGGTSPVAGATLQAQSASTGAGSKVSSKTKEIVIELTEPPAGLQEGAEVTIELGSASGRASSSRPKLAADASSGSSWLTTFLVCEGVAATLALCLAAYYWLEAQRKAQALEAVNAAGGPGKASPTPGFASPGTLENGSRPSPSRSASGSRRAVGRGSPASPPSGAFSPSGRRRGARPPSPGQLSLQSSPSVQKSFGQV